MYTLCNIIYLKTNKVSVSYTLYKMFEGRTGFVNLSSGCVPEKDYAFVVFPNNRI